MLLHDRDQLVDGDHLARAQVDGRGDQLRAVHDQVDAVQAVVDVAERARLRPVAPDLDAQVAAVLRLEDLAAHRGRCLLATAEPGAVGAVDVVEAGDVGLQAAFRPVLLAEHLADELLPAVAALGHGRVGVGLLERDDVGRLLQVRVVGAGRRGEEVALHAGPVGGLGEVRVDEDAAQALHAEVLDEAHAAHVRGEVVDLGRALDGVDGVLLVAEVHGDRLDARHAQVPVGQGLAVDGPDVRVALLREVARQRPGDEAAGPGDHDEVVLGQAASDAGTGDRVAELLGHRGSTSLVCAGGARPEIGRVRAPIHALAGLSHEAW